MTVVVFIESQDGVIKKASLEAISYGRSIADNQGHDLIGVGFSIKDFQVLNSYGLDKLYNIDTQGDYYFNVERYSSNISSIIEKEKASIAIVSASADSRYLGPVLSVKIDAAYLSNVIELPSQYEPLKVKRSCFTNKAFNETQSEKKCTVLSLSSNSFGLKEKPGKMEVISESYSNFTNNLKVSSLDKVTDKVSIADADIVVSGGRGLKGPENWHLIEDLAEVLGAATACSKPVSDMGWRSHSEHVGQTGKPVASNLYIAIGVSGAIQHIAGIKDAGTIVAVNKDADAPIFEIADYAVIGDLMEIVPKLTEEINNSK